MYRKTFLALLGFLVLGLTALPGATIAATPTPQNSTSAAGYALTASAGNNITSIKASWLVPSLTCSGTNSYSNMSIMIDGFTDSDLLRIGTTANCISGVATYGVLLNLKLTGGVVKIITPLPTTIKAGDLIEAAGSWNTGGSPKHGGATNQGWRATLTDVNAVQTGKISDKSTTKAALNSAAFLVGKPSGPLANFGTAGFGYATTGIRSTCELTAGFSNHTVFKAISIGLLGNQKGFTLTQYGMVNGLDVLATTNSLDVKGKSFTVTFNAAT